LKVVVLQSNYIPWKGYFDLINDADVFVYYDETQYTKNDWRNRNKIYAVNAEQWLSIPIAKGAVKLKISEVQIKDASWQKLHYKSIYHAYKKAPFFSQIESLINEVYLEKKWLSLIELDRYLIEKISAMIGIKTRFVDSKNFDLSGEKVERLINILIQLGATQYISGPAAKDYLTGSEYLFEKNGIELIYKDYSAYPQYKQMREPFVHSVSILDLLVNVGLDEVGDYIWNTKK
jgi:hypothetical protein